ncbi:MAG: C25 family peptidase propeptide domain-containing protein, partial [Candidatus Fermentibacteria bacterium]
MKRTFLLTLLAVASVFAAGQGSVSAWQSFGGALGESPEVTVLESDQNHMVLEISIPGFWLYDKPAEGTTWNCVELPECFPQGKVGLPDLPSVVELFALPFGTRAVATVEEVTSTTYANMEILPRQTPEIDMAHAPFPFVIENEFYQSGQSFPSAALEIDNEGIWSGLNVARLVVNPFSYNPSTGNMEVVSSITLRVDFEGTAVQLSDPVTPSMALEMERTVINWDVFEASATSLGNRDDGVEYVFICTENTVDWVTELFETHHYLGLHVRVEVLPASGATTDDVKIAITDNYTTGVTRFACIVGGHDDLPSYNYGSFYGDYFYACLTGGDDHAEIAVGRLTGNQAQIELQVDKIMTGYMDYAFDDSYTTGIAPSEAVLAAHGENYPLKYTQCCNEIAAYPYSLCDMSFIKVYPPEGGTAAMVSDAINNDIGTITYRGHGDVTVWTWAPGWSATNINALTNT